MKKQNTKYVLLVLLILVFITGFRYNLGGSDFLVYKIAYESVPNLMNFISDYHKMENNIALFSFERGYLLYISIIKTLTGFSFYGYLVVQSVLFYTLMYLGLRRYVEYWGLFLLLFMYKMFFYETFISMRQPITIVSFYFIMKYIELNKPVKYFLILILFLLPLHNGAYLLFVVYAVSFFRITKQRVIILTIIFLPFIIVSEFGFDPLKNLTFLSVLSSDETMNKKIADYSNANERLNLIHSLEYVLILFLIIINYDKLIQYSKHAEFVIKIFLILLPIFTLFRNSVFFRREFDYFIPMYAIILGYLCSIYKNRRYYILLSLSIICLWGYIRFILLFDKGAMMPYSFWLFQNDANWYN